MNRIMGSVSVMQETGNLGVTPLQEQKLKIALENTCELCREYFPSPFLELHRISRRNYREMSRDASTRFLGVCTDCHAHIHALPVPVARQRQIVRNRSFFVRKDLRKILGYVPKPYIPPQSVDPSQAYEEYFGRCPQGSYRMGG